MRLPMIDADGQREIDRHIVLAKSKPISAVDLEAAIVATGDALFRWKRRLDEFTMRLPSDFVVTYTQEYHPGGLCHHINMSQSGSLPHPTAMKLLCEAFGMPNVEDKHRIIRAWPEHYPNGQTSAHIIMVI